MPELPEVETVRRGLQPVMEGARFVRVEQRRPDLRFPFPKNFNKRLEGATVEGLNRRAKYLLADLSSGEVLLMHLGMSGSFRVLHGSDEKGPGKFHHARGKLSAHDHVVFHMSNGAIVTFNDPRRFGYMKLIARDALARDPMIALLGPEPLGNAFDGAMLAEACAGQEDLAQGGAVGPARRGGARQHLCVRGAAPRASLAQAHRLDDRERTRREPNERAHALADSIRAVLNDAIRAGGSSLRDHRRTDGELGDFQHNFRVYDRAGEKCPTPRCKGTIKRIVQGTRSTFFCPVCQK